MKLKTLGRDTYKSSGDTKNVVFSTIQGGLENRLIKAGEKISPEVPPSLFPLHSSCAFIGRTNSGKTNSAVVLAQEYIKHKSINTVFCISPTFDQNRYFETLNIDEKNVFKGQHALFNSEACLKVILKRIKNLSREYKDYLDYVQAYEKYKKGTADMFELTLVKNHNYEKPIFMERPSPLLILDDLSHTEIYSSSRRNSFNNLLLRHRHIYDLGVSIFMLVQNFRSGIPLALRQNIKVYFIWKTHDERQLEAIYEEIAGSCKYDEFIKVYEEATSEPHHFLTVDLYNNDPKHIFRKDFKTYLNLT